MLFTYICLNTSLCSLLIIILETEISISPAFKTPSPIIKKQRKVVHEQNELTNPPELNLKDEAQDEAFTPSTNLSLLQTPSTKRRKAFAKAVLDRSVFLYFIYVFFYSPIPLVST